MTTNRLTEVTPEMAQKWLQDTNSHNRTISEACVQKFAQDMANGAWGLTHQGVAFAEDGTLLDGQHRLAAIVRTGTPVMMFVCRGLPKSHQNGVQLDTIDLIDRGRVRGVGQQLQLSHGYKNGNLTAAAAKVCAELCCGMQLATISTPQTLAVLAHFGREITQTQEDVSQSRDRKAVLVGTIAFARRAMPVEGAAFSAAYFSMVDIPQNSPIHALRKWLDKHPQNAGSARRPSMEAVATAFHHYCAGSRIQRLVPSREHVASLLNRQKSRVRQVAELFAIVTG